MEAQPPRVPHVRATKGRWGRGVSPPPPPGAHHPGDGDEAERQRRGEGGPPGGGGGGRGVVHRGGVGGRLTDLLAEGFRGDAGCKRSQRSNHPNLLTRLTPHFTVGGYCWPHVIFPNPELTDQLPGQLYIIFLKSYILALNLVQLYTKYSTI